MKKIFTVHLFSYPLYVAFNIIQPLDLTYIWGILLSILIIIFYIANPKYIKHLNHFETASLFFIIASFFVIFLNTNPTFEKVYTITKYATPLLTTSLFIRYYPNPSSNTVKLTRRFVGVGIIIFYFFTLIHISSLNLVQILNQKEELWLEKSHIIAQMYAALVIYYFAVKKYGATIKEQISIFVLIAPIIVFGVRSVFLASFLYYAVLIFQLIKNRNNFLLKVLIGLTVLIVIVFSDQIFTIENFSFLNTRQEGSLDVDQFSSGRLTIWLYYFTNFTPINLLIGNGLIYLNPESYGFRLHNEFLEFFFTYGVWGIFFYYYLILYKLFYKRVRQNPDQQNKTMQMAILLYFMVLGFFNGLMDYQSTIFIYLAFYYLNIDQNQQLQTESLNTT